MPANTATRLTSQRRLTCTAQMPAPSKATAQTMLNAVAGTTVLVMNANDASLAFIERSSISGSPHNEPIQKPKLTSSSEVREAVIASRSYSAGRRSEARYATSANAENSTTVRVGSKIASE